MSYVPATFTAGFALVLTAAGAASGQWVSDLRRAYAQVAPVQAEPESAEEASERFLARTAAYATFHDEVEKAIPALTETSDPKKIAERERALGEALIKARPGARPGEYFGDFAIPIRRIIRTDFMSRSAADRKALVQEVPPGIKVDINTHYPTTLPLATFPPALLQALPDLPDVLEYRIVGRDLILLDTKGNVVVDVLRGVLPA
jgi:hypothetical protein